MDEIGSGFTSADVDAGCAPAANNDPFLGGLRGGGESAKKWLDDVDDLGGGVNDDVRGSG